MPKYNLNINQFNGGEISDRADSRNDLNIYSSSVKVMENFVPLLEGQATKLPGTKYISAVTDASNRDFFVRFKFSEDDAYVLVFGDLRVDVYNQAGTNVHNFVTTYAQADFFDSAGRLRFDFDQSADTIWIAHEDYPLATLVRISETNWSLTDYELFDGPWDELNVTATTMTPAATTGSGINLTASAATFAATDVGRLIRIGHSGEWGYGVIATFSSTTLVTVNIIYDFFATTATLDWRFGIYGQVNGYPSIVKFIQNRLTLSGIPKTEFSERFDMSMSGIYNRFSPDEPSDAGVGNPFVVTDASAIGRSLTGDVNEIRWIQDNRRGMIVGTSGGIWLVSPSNRNEAITQSNINAVRTSNIGTSKYVRGVKADNTIIHAQRFGQRVREVAYSFEEESMSNRDMTRLAEHIAQKNPVIKIEYQASPQPILWVLHQDGKLSAALYSKDEQVIGWCRLPKTNMIIEDIMIMPNGADSYDILWLLVKRTINSATVRYVERLEPFWRDGDLKEGAFFVDCGIQYDSTATATITGLSHLEGESVAVLADGNVHPNKTVASGQITLDYTAEKVSVGLPYTSKLTSLELFASQQSGVTLAYNSRIIDLVIKVWQSLNGKFGTPADSTNKILFRDQEDVMDSSPPLFTGRIDLESIGDDWSFESQFTIQHDDPLPFTLSAAYPRLEVPDE